MNASHRHRQDVADELARRTLEELGARMTEIPAAGRPPQFAPFDFAVEIREKTVNVHIAPKGGHFEVDGRRIDFSMQFGAPRSAAEEVQEKVFGLPVNRDAPRHTATGRLVQQMILLAGQHRAALLRENPQVTTKAARHELFLNAPPKEFRIDLTDPTYQANGGYILVGELCLDHDRQVEFKIVSARTGAVLVKSFSYPYFTGCATKALDDVLGKLQRVLKPKVPTGASSH